MKQYQSNQGMLVTIKMLLPYWHSNEDCYVLEDRKSKELFIISVSDFKANFSEVVEQLTTIEKLELYQSLFKGRKDVYAKSYVNADGKINYFPSYDYGWKQLPPERRTTQSFTQEAIKRHLRGKERLGIFPILSDNTCWFLALDLDKKDWKVASLELVDLARKYGFDPALEISRSGQGAHIWFFFDAPISCQLVRQFGRKLLTLAMQQTESLSFDSFDRLFPNQDFLPKGGFGNLIALPLQGQSYQENRTVFVNRQFQPYTNQWQFLASLTRINVSDLQHFLNLPEVEQDWSDFPLLVTKSQVLAVLKSSLTASIMFELKRLSSFKNPEFYRAQALRKPVYQIPETIYLFEEDDDFLFLPRGIETLLRERFDNIVIEDETKEVRPLKVTFNGELYFDQSLALDEISNHDAGVIQAPPGFGKTVIALALLARVGVPTLILVHNQYLLEQWQNQIERYLTIDEPSVMRLTPKGRKKEIGTVGTYSSKKKTLTGLVDVGMIQSFSKQEAIQQLLSHYDMLVVDECHHIAAATFELVIRFFAGRYLYGFTATPERQNGHEPILFKRIGPLIFEAKEGEVPFEKQLFLRFTSFGKMNAELTNHHSFTELSDLLAQDKTRNNSLVEDILENYQEGRQSIVLTNRLVHLKELQKNLEISCKNLFVISGQTKAKERETILQRLDRLPKNEPALLLSTGKFFGEGIDIPRLDTLFLAGPLSWKNSLTQYIGRIHRPFKGKEVVRVYDYVDIHQPQLARMFQKRQATYRKLNYKVAQTNHELPSFYRLNQAWKQLKQDVKNSQSLVVSVSYPTKEQVLRLLEILPTGCRFILKTLEQNKWLLSLIHPQHVEVQFYKRLIGDYLIIDKQVVWYGNQSLLSQSRREANFLRLESRSLANELDTNL